MESKRNINVKCPPIIDGKNFKLVRFEGAKIGTKIIAKCLLCQDGKEISGNTNSTGNFLLHLKRCHQEEHDEVKKRKVVEIAAPKQNLKHFIQGITRGSQKFSDRLVLSYIVNSMRPLSTVSDPYFIAMIKGHCQDSSINVMTRYALEDALEASYKQTVLELTKEISATDYICITADCWSSHARSFLGMTAHWINGDFTRESRALSCMRFKGVHSYDRIAERLFAVMENYKIPINKVVAIVTDNGSNFCKAFREFASNAEKDEDECDEQDSTTDNLVEICCVPDPNGNAIPEFFDDSNDEPFYHDIIFDVMSQTAANPGSSSDKKKLQLPPHFRCVSHTLSLVATTDLKKAKGRQTYNKVMGKCTKLWNLSTSPKSAEIIIASCGKNFKRPVPTRWNSLYDSINRLLSLKHGLNEACAKLGVPTFSDKELDFLQEYANISAPVAAALDKMQGENGLFMGAVLPTLRQTEKKLLELRETVKHCDSFLQAYLSGIQHRFEHILNFDKDAPSDLVYAAISHPLFKLRWTPSPTHEDLKKAFINEARNYYDSSLSCTKDKQSDSDDPFYDFDDDQGDKAGKDIVELECVKYLNDPVCDLCILGKYPIIKKMFMKYNTSLPSSAPVERLFSYGGIIFSARRCRLTDKRFEQLVILKCNKVFR